MTSKTSKHYTIAASGTFSEEELKKKFREAFKTQHKPEPTRVPDPVVPEEPDLDFEETPKAEGQMFSDVFGFKPLNIPDFQIRIDRSWSQWAEQFIPDRERFQHWVWPECTAEVVYTLLHGLKTRAVGAPGCGKTELGAAVCAYLGVPYFSLSMNAAVEVTDLAGKTNIKDGDTVFVESDLVRMYRESGTRMIQPNELSRMRADVAMFFQPAWDDQNYLLLQEKENDNIVRPGPGLMWYGTDNTLGLGDDMDKYSAANVLDGSTLDRWQATYRVSYLPADKEVALVQSWQPSIREPLARKIVQFANLCRSSYSEGTLSLPLSPRHVKAIAELTVAWKSPVAGIRTVVWNAVPADEQAGLRGLFDTVGFASKYGSL